MDHVFEDFLNGLDAAQNDDETWNVFTSSAEKLGFNTVMHTYLPDLTDEVNGQSIHRTTYADDWMQHWDAQGYNDIDIPIRRTMEAGYAPMVMDVDDYIEKHHREEDERAIFSLYEARQEGGCRRIYSHRLFHGAMGGGGIGLVSDCLSSWDFKATVDQNAPTLSAMIHMAHARLAHRLIGPIQAIKPKLSGRQRDMLAGISKGMTYQQIANLYGLSENTVAYHVAALKKKLDCKTSREVLIEACRHGLLSKL